MRERDAAFLFERFTARDAAYDGRFLTGVLSTGIYCLPSCTAKKPLRKNVRFFDSERAAQEGGFRPCRRCRPDDFYRSYDPDLELVDAALRAMRSEPERFIAVGDLARRVGVGVSKLTSLFREHLHDTPASILRREKVTVAADHLLGSSDGLLDVAGMCGFQAPSVFYDNFARVMRMPPGEYRKLASRGTFDLALPADYATELVLRVLGRDSESICEELKGRTFRKALLLEGRPAVLTISFESHAARCAVDADQLSAQMMAEAHLVALKLTGLATDPSGFSRRARSEEPIARLIRGREGMRIPQTATVFEAIAWAIIGQQVNLTFAFQLRRTVAELAGTPVGGFTAHPDASAVAKLDYADLTARKFSRSKAEYLIDTARRIAAGDLRIDAWPDQPVSRVSREFLAVRGIGAWSCNYVLMRGCGFADCVPLGDTGLSSGLQEFFALDHRPERAEVEELMKQFAPHRSFATTHLWMRKGDAA